MSNRSRVFPWLALAALASFSGCGGNAEGNGPENTGGQAGLGGQSTGGVTAAGGAMSTGGVSTSGAPGAGGGICCTAAAVCKDGDKELVFDQPCPGGYECYTNSICCSTVWCARLLPSGTGGAPSTGGAPGNGGTPNTGGTSGSAGAAGEAGASCDPANEPDRKYAATNPRSCLLIDFVCPTTTKYFSNDCGCGCEQPADCPDYVDCMPGPQPSNPLCVGQPEQSRCPYTLRAL